MPPNRDAATRRRGPARAFDVVEPGATTCVGGLPHRSPDQAARFALRHFDIPPIPFLPRRSPGASSIQRALVGVPGVALGHYGAIAVDVGALDPDGEVRTPLAGEPFAGFRAFVDRAAEQSWSGTVLWHFAGPLSVGSALVRAGAGPEIAFDVARAAVSAHLRSITAAVAAALPDAPQIVVLDEPDAAGINGRGFPLSSDEAIDLLSSALAVVEPDATAGVRGGPDVDLALLLEAGPELISVPVTDVALPIAGYLNRFMRNGGWVCWGVVPTGGPVGTASDRARNRLVMLWAELAARGCVPRLLRDQCLLAPDGGLSLHHTESAERICRSVSEVSADVRAQPAPRDLPRA